MIIGKIKGSVILVGGVRISISRSYDGDPYHAKETYWNKTIEEFTKLLR